MKPEKGIIAEPPVEDSDQDEMLWPEPQTELGAKIIALAKEIHYSAIPKLSIDEIEEYLDRRNYDWVDEDENGQAADVR